MCIFTSKEMGKIGRYISAANSPISAALKSGITILKSAESRFMGIQFIVCFRCINYFYTLYIVCVQIYELYVQSNFD